MKKIFIIVLMILAIKSKAQNPAPYQVQKGELLFYNATIYDGNGKIIPNGWLLVENGKIKNMGSEYKDILSNQSQKVDLQGFNVYPGIISPNNALGLTEIEAVRTTSDESEIGDFNPNVASKVAYNTDSEIIPTVRGNGVLITQATPEGGTIAGRSSIFNLDGWNWEDALIKQNDGLWINWPSRKVYNAEIADYEKNKKYFSIIDDLTSYFKQSEVFDNKSNVNLKLAGLQSVLNDNGRVYIQFNTSKEAIDAIQFCKSTKIKFPVLVGEISSDLLIDQLKINNIPVLIPGTHRISTNNDSDVWGPYKMPSKLFDAGILVGMYYNVSQWRTRNLPFNAGNAVAYGLSKENALKMITINNAKILGIEKQVGSLEIGKSATFIVSKGDILDMKSSKILQAFINGNEVNLDDKQKRLSKKYYDKYNIN